jgi:hypothetical protein
MPLEITKPLTDLQADALSRVDQLATKVREKFLTPGQDSTYADKLTDARAYKAASGKANAADFVWIDAEATATGKTHKEVADAVIAASGQWAIKGAQIEGQRQAAKQAIKAATNAATIRSAEQLFKTHMETL